MGIKRGTLEVGAIFRGSTIISKVYKGTTVIYELADGSYYELIEDLTISTATTSVQFSGFTATKEDSLVLVSDLINVGTNGNLSLLFNNNLTITNYYFQQLVAFGTSVSGFRGNNNSFLTFNTGLDSINVVDIKLTNDGYGTVQSNATAHYGDSTPELWNFVVSSTFTMSSITQLDIVSAESNSIGIGSRFQLYRRLN